MAVSLVYLILIAGLIKTFLQLKQGDREKEESLIESKRKKLRNSFNYALQGIFTALKEEQNMKIHFIIMLIVIIAGFLYHISYIEWIVCLLLFAFVISLELINTAIETTVDIASPEFNEKAKIAKDVAAGAVLVSAIISVLIGLIIFIPKIF